MDLLLLLLVVVVVVGVPLMPAVDMVGGCLQSGLADATDAVATARCQVDEHFAD